MNVEDATVIRPKKRKIIFLTLMLCTIALNLETALCWDDVTNHPDMTERSITTTGLDNYLVNHLGISEGLKKQYTYHPSTFSLYPVPISILDMLRMGSTDEDSPMCRASNHFHDPLKTWDNSYLTDMTAMATDWRLFFTGLVWEVCLRQGWESSYSNVTWGTGYLSPPTAQTNPSGRLRQEMGWDDARSHYFQGLISASLAERNDNLVSAFRALGQTTHLLQDMAVPAHVRNDFQGHINRADKWLPSANLFEYYVERHPKSVKELAIDCVVGSRPEFNNPRVTDFWDKDEYDGTNPEVTLSRPVGLSEFTNANYLSQSTIPVNNPIPAHTYPWPRIDNPIDNNVYKVCLDFSHEPDEFRYYLSRVSRTPSCGPWGQVDHFAAVSLITPPNFTPVQVKGLTLDENVNATYANELVPKATGYSAELIDHFFRGTIEIQVDNTSTFRTVKLTAKNTTANGDDMPGGDLYLVVRYKEWLETPAGSGYRYVNFPGGYQYKVYHLPSQPRIPKGSENPVELTFDLSADPIPFRAWDVSVQLVYKGILGGESGAVAVGRTPVAALWTDIDISLPASGIYAKANDSGTDNAFRTFALTARTDVPGGFADPDGKIELEVEYRVAKSDPFASQTVDTDPPDAKAYLIRVSELNDVKTLPQGQPVELHFNLGATPLPTWATDVFVNLIYRRTSDPETKWLGVGRRDISEPTPVDVFNNTDRVCINGLWYPNDTPEQIATALAAVNNESDVYPHIFTNVFGEISSFADNALASLSRYDVSKPGPQAQGTLLTLGHILTDYSFSYSFLATWNKVYGDDPWTTSSPAKVLTGTGVKNQEEPGGRIFPTMYRMRNNPMWWGTGIVYENPRYPTNSPCDWNTIP